MCVKININHYNATMKRKEYQKPTMQVVKLQQQTQLLAGSGELPGMPGYPGGGDPFNP